MADHKADIVMTPHHPITHIMMSIVHGGENERKSSEILHVKKLHIPTVPFVHLYPKLNVHLDLFWHFFVHLRSSEIDSFG